MGSVVPEVKDSVAQSMGLLWDEEFLGLEMDKGT